MKSGYYLALIAAFIGIAITAYWATASGGLEVFGEEIRISPGTYTARMNESSIYTKNITVSTSSKDEIDVEIKVLPADYSTADEWGTNFIAFASPDEVTVDDSNSAKVTILHYCENAGSYRVKIVAAK
jgi:hypothetical protein